MFIYIYIYTYIYIYIYLQVFIILWHYYTYTLVLTCVILQHYYIFVVVLVCIFFQLVWIIQFFRTQCLHICNTSRARFVASPSHSIRPHPPIIIWWVCNLWKLSSAYAVSEDLYSFLALPYTYDAKRRTTTCYNLGIFCPYHVTKFKFVKQSVNAGS